jgi:O-antigen/teichoic acid export membrane protein
MSRVRLAALTASFSYLQYGLAIASGLILVPVTIAAVGARDYGLWLATGELLGYAGMVDLGVLGVLPWMVAEADGRRDRAKLRELVANGVVVGSVVGIGYLAVAAFLWTLLPLAVSVSPADRRNLAEPLMLLVGATAVAYPFRTFNALLTGLQDAVFNGVLSIAQSAAYFLVAIVGLWQGWGLYALAAGSALSTSIGLVAAVARTALTAPDLLAGWPRPRLSAIRALLSNGAGVWAAGLGWRLVTASTNMVIAFVGRAEWVAVYACTAKLSTLSTQLAWVLPDSGLVGLSQLQGEGQPAERLRRVVLMILRLHLVLAGTAACAVLAFNPAFVATWVGFSLYGGHSLNAWLAAGVVVSSLAHAVITTASVLGNRLQVGAATLVHGAAQMLLALAFGQWWGLAGIAAASFVAASVTSVPAGIALLRRPTGLSAARVWSELRPAFQRFGPAAAVSLAAGVLVQRSGLPAAVAVTALCLAACFWAVRPLLWGLPLDDRWAARLSRAGVIPLPEEMRPSDSPTRGLSPFDFAQGDPEPVEGSRAAAPAQLRSRGSLARSLATRDGWFTR